MAVPPWLDISPKDFARSAESGAQAGIEVGAARQRGAIAAANIAAEQQRLGLAAQAQQNAMERAGAELDQARVESQARQELAREEAARRSQEAANLNEYRQQEVLKGQQMLAEQKRMHDERLSSAAMSLSHQQGFANAVANGVPVAQALYQFPMTPHAVVSAIAPQTLKDYGPIVSEEVPGIGTVAYRQHSPGMHVGPPNRDVIKRGDEAEYLDVRKRLNMTDLDTAEKTRLLKRKQELETQLKPAAMTATGTESPIVPAATNAPRRLRDKSGTVWEYLGTGDPKTDRDPDNWQKAQ